MDRKLIYQDNKYKVYQSFKGYDFHFFVVDLKEEAEDSNWFGFLYGEETKFHEWCQEHNISEEKIEYYCGACEAKFDKQFKLEYSQDKNGLSTWTCPNCGCSTSFPEEDGCYTA